MSQHAAPVLIPSQGPVRSLNRLAFGETTARGGYDEAWLQSTLFDHPDALPCVEIDPAYVDLVPLCREMESGAGPIDLVYVTPQGRLVLIETKLWRNPEARREVVAQILDYAKSLSKWEYEDLQREVNRASKMAGATLYSRVANRSGALVEAHFVDQVSRNLRAGQFLLLIVGDGIREGVRAMTEFLEQFGSLEFTFGLIEVGVYDIPDVGRLLQPRILAKTLIVKRSIVVVEAGLAVWEDSGQEVEKEDAVDPAALAKRKEQENFYLGFWKSLLANLHLDDSSQPMAKVNTGTNIYFAMPPSGGTAWVSAYFAQSKSRVGVYLTFARHSQFGEIAWKSLQARKDEIERELGVPVEWQGTEVGKYSITARLPYERLDEVGLQSIREFFEDRLNRFVNVFRPRLENLVEKL